jgi:hypothetical protein
MAGCPHIGVDGAEVRNLLGEGEDAGFAGDDEEAVRGIATEPARPLQAARVDGTIKAVANQGIGDQAG